MKIKGYSSLKIEYVENGFLLEPLVFGTARSYVFSNINDLIKWIRDNYKELNEKSNKKTRNSGNKTRR